MKEAIPLGLKRILRKINFRIDTLILAALKSKAEVALFHGIYKIVHDFIFMAESSLQSIFPVFARYYNKDNDSFTLAYEKYFKFLTIIAIPFALFLSSFASEIIKLVLGPKFLSATPALQILGWMITFMFLTNLMERVLIVAGKQRICTVLTMIALSINIIFDFLLIPRWSFVGASIATLVSEIVLMATSFYYVHKLIIKKGVLTEVLKPMGSGIITLIFLYIFRNANFFLTAILGFFLYIIILILTNTFTKEERTILMKALRKAEL
jgi:O-antigen/teichoic acid export membrane protein